MMPHQSSEHRNRQNRQKAAAGAWEITNSSDATLASRTTGKSNNERAIQRCRSRVNCIRLDSSKKRKRRRKHEKRNGNHDMPGNIISLLLNLQQDDLHLLTIFYFGQLQEYLYINISNTCSSRGRH
eukprot:scpid24724/ scgid14493/ 